MDILLPIITGSISTAYAGYVFIHTNGKVRRVVLAAVAALTMVTTLTIIGLAIVGKPL